LTGEPRGVWGPGICLPGKQKPGGKGKPELEGGPEYGVGEGGVRGGDSSNTKRAYKKGKGLKETYRGGGGPSFPGRQPKP